MIGQSSDFVHLQLGIYIHGEQMHKRVAGCNECDDLFAEQFGSASDEFDVECEVFHLLSGDRLIVRPDLHTGIVGGGDGQNTTVGQHS